MIYEVTVSRTGCLYVEASSPEEAKNIADRQPSENVSWTDDWNVIDCREDEEPEFHKNLYGCISKKLMLISKS